MTSITSIGYPLTSQIFLKSFQYTGIWFPENFSYLYSFYAAVLYIVFSVMYASFTVVRFFYVESVSESMEALFLITIVFSIFTKTSSFLYYNRSIRKLFHRMHNDIELHNEFERNLINRKLRSFIVIVIVFFILCLMAVSSGVIISALQPKKQLPFGAWHPLNYTIDRASFWVAWSHISFATCIAISTNAGVQCFSSYLMFFTSTLMEVLGQRLSKLWSADTKIVKSKWKQRTDSGDELIGCIKMHQQLLELVICYICERKKLSILFFKYLGS